jgi:hypothetical protein
VPSKRSYAHREENSIFSKDGGPIEEQIKQDTPGQGREAIQDPRLGPWRPYKALSASLSSLKLITRLRRAFVRYLPRMPRKPKATKVDEEVNEATEAKEAGEDKAAALSLVF